MTRSFEDHNPPPARRRRGRRLLAVVLMVAAAVAASRAEAQFSNPNTGNLPTANFSPGAGDDTGRLQDLIDENRFNNGGVITIQSGTYQISKINPRSNIHLRLQGGVRIDQVGQTNAIFEFDDGVRTVSVAGTSSSNKAVISARMPSSPNGSNFRAFRFGDVDDFRVANIQIIERNTRFSTMVCSTDASNGTVENIDMEGAGPGWGLIQFQGGSNIVVRNLDGQGGFTLRLEQAGGSGQRISNITARNIICQDGRGAVLLAPANPNNGRVNIRDVMSFGCQWAVVAGDGKNGGRFSRATIRNVEGVYGRSAQFRRRSQGVRAEDFLPQNQRGFVENIPNLENNKFQTGPSAGVLRGGDAGWYRIRRVQDGTNFPSSYGNQDARVDDAEFDRLLDLRS